MPMYDVVVLGVAPLVKDQAPEVTLTLVIEPGTKRMDCDNLQDAVLRLVVHAAKLGEDFRIVIQGRCRKPAK